MGQVMAKRRWPRLLSVGRDEEVGEICLAIDRLIEMGSNMLAQTKLHTEKRLKAFKIWI